MACPYSRKMLHRITTGERTRAGSPVFLKGAIIPLSGAHRLSQLEDNPGVLDFALDDVQSARLTVANALAPPYPHTFWNGFVRRDLIFGERVDKLQMWAQTDRGLRG